MLCWCVYALDRPLHCDAICNVANNTRFARRAHVNPTAPVIVYEANSPPIMLRQLRVHGFITGSFASPVFFNVCTNVVPVWIFCFWYKAKPRPGMFVQRHSVLALCFPNRLHDSVVLTLVLALCRGQGVFFICRANIFAIIQMHANHFPIGIPRVVVALNVKYVFGACWMFSVAVLTHQLWSIHLVGVSAQRLLRPWGLLQRYPLRIQTRVPDLKLIRTLLLSVMVSRRW